jgi:hypothetical protein
LEDFITVVEQHGVSVQTVRAGEWDLSTPSGRMTARILGSVARGESEHKSDRVRRALEQRATMGISHGRIAYGWTRSVLPDGTKVETVNEAQAALVSDVAQRDRPGREACAGSWPTSTPAGSPRPPQDVGQDDAAAPRHPRAERRSARASRGGRRLGGVAADPRRGLWEQARAVLTDPARKTSTSSAAVHLLSGIARCGICGGPMRASLNRTVPSYRCADKACVSRNRRDVDELVTGVVLARLARPDLAGLLAPADDSTRQAVAEVAELRARLDHAADDYADGTLDREQFHRITERLRPRLEQAQARVRTVDSTPLLAELVGREDVRAVWEGLPLSRQRGVVDLLLSIRVLRANQGRAPSTRVRRDHLEGVVTEDWRAEMAVRTTSCVRRSTH